MLKALDTANEVRRSGAKHDVFTHAAAMAFFLLFSLPALVIVLVVLAGFLPVERMLQVSDADLTREIRHRLESSLPPESAAVVVDFVDAYFGDAESAVGAVFEKRPVKEASGALAKGGGLGSWLGRAMRERQRWMLLIGFLVVLWSASSATRAGMTAMNNIHEVGQRSALARAVKSVVLTIAMGVGTLVVLAVLPFGNLVARAVADHEQLGRGVLVAWQVVNWCLGVGLLLLLVATIQKHGPNKRLGYRDVLGGSSLTVALWIGISMGLKLWTEHGWDSFGVTYGAMAGLVVLLTWCYFSSTALLLGAEVVAHRRRHLRGRKGKQGRRRGLVLSLLRPRRRRRRRGRAA